MKKLFLPLVFILFSLVATAQSKTGSIDADYILSKMPEMGQVEEGIKAYNTELQGDLDSTVANYETLIADYQENNASFEEDQRKEKENEIIALENEIKGFRQKATMMMQMKRNELTKPLYEKIDGAMLKVIGAEGFTHIFHAGSGNLAFFAEQFDITEQVMEQMGLATE